MANVLNRTTLNYRASVNTPGYPVSDWVINPDMSPVDGVDRKYWVLIGDTLSVMTTAQKDAAISTWQAEKKAELLAAVNAKGSEHYLTDTEMRLKHEYNKAVAAGLTNRAAYIKAALDWSNTLIADWMGRDAVVNAATTHDEVTAISANFDSHDASDPAISVAGAVQVAG